MADGSLQPNAYEPKQIHAPRRVAPLVVVPAGHLHERSVDDVRALRVQDARVRVADVVGRDELLLRIAEDALEWAVRRGLEGGVDLVDRHRSLDFGGEIGQ